MSSDSTEKVTINEELIKSFKSISIARKELNNIRKEVRCLNLCYQKNINNILTTLKTWKCESCCSISENHHVISPEANNKGSVPLQPIGIISTSFHEKRGIPRQSGICSSSQGRLTLLNTIFTNPDHALEGLNEYSHMWILFNFHKNDSTHVRSKVAPPRLNGLKTGVFSTRSPHRPSPIGLSLVHVDYIDGSSIYFSGVDMLDGSPVFDIKPYIPQYDNPILLTNQWNSNLSHRNISVDELSDRSSIPREAPDGEEGSSADDQLVVSNIPNNEQIRVPRWVTDSTVGQLTVTFKEKALADLDAIKKNQSLGSSSEEKEDLELCIGKILQEDPRSVYVRERYSNQFYTFLIGKYHVSCKFDDCNRCVQVFKIEKANPLSE